MAYKITSKCISCDRCESVCPQNAIQTDSDRPWIDPQLCNNCDNTIHRVPQCVAGCPTYNGCIKEPTLYWEKWFNTYNTLVAELTQKTDYWENWFNTYSQKYAEHLQHKQPA